MTGAICAVAWLGAMVGPGLAKAAGSCAAPPSPRAPLPADLIAAAAHANTYPTFCSIPPTPTDVRGAAAFNAVVVETRLAGADLAIQGAASTFSLNGTDDFAVGARGAAAAPPPMTPADEPGTEAFIKEMRAKATPPPRPR